MLIESHICRVGWHNNGWPWVTLNGRFTLKSSSASRAISAVAELVVIEMTVSDRNPFPHSLLSYCYDTDSWKVVCWDKSEHMGGAQTRSGSEIRSHAITQSTAVHCYKFAADRRRLWFQVTNRGSWLISCIIRHISIFTINGFLIDMHHPVFGINVISFVSLKAIIPLHLRIVCICYSIIFIRSFPSLSLSCSTPRSFAPNIKVTGFFHTSFPSKTAFVDFCTFFRFHNHVHQ